MEKLKFIRYGGLSPVKQTQYLPDGHPDKSFHNPPKKRGIYAMIKGYEDTFLLGATNQPNHISGKTQWLKDENGNHVEDTRTYDENKNTNWGYVCPPELKKLLKRKGVKETQLGSKSLKIDEDCPIKKCDDCTYTDCCENKRYLTILKTPKIFEYTGELWHHLEGTTEQHEIIETNGSWVKTSYDAFLKAFKKDKHIALKELHKDVGTISYKPNNDPYRGLGITYTKDHLEVFIEKL